MMRFLAVVLLTVSCMGACLAGEAGAKGQAVPYRVVPIEAFSSVVKNWGDDSMPHYAIMNNVGEWELAFQPTVVMGSNKPTHPGPEVFEKVQLVSISRVSDAPAPGEKVLSVKSLNLVDGELVLTYVFAPPAKKASYKAKSTILVAIPVTYQNPLRISEDIETPETRIANAELEEAIKAGRFKPEAPQQ